MAAPDYYKTLNLTRSASPADINAAYRREVLLSHPDRAADAAAAARFPLISEAYDVLSQGKLRAVYDQYGSLGLTGGAPVAGTKAFTAPYVFSGDSAGIFRAFFGTDNPFQAAVLPHDELGVDKSQGQQTRRVKDPDVVEELLVTLEEAFAGCVKKMRITHRVLNDDGHTSTVQDKILTVTVKPGWTDGARITFPNEGDQNPNNIPADVVFVLKYKPHPVFARQGNNLVHVAPIALADALTGSILELPTLDGRKLNIPLNEIVHPHYEKLVPGEGMPIPTSPGAKGDLILRFNVLFPKSLSEDKRRLVRQGLAA